jgi:hypothetical protein
MLTGLSSAPHAATLKGVTMADKATVGGKELVLNGMGMRTATVLKVKVYAMGLYLEQKSSDADAIAASAQAKRVVQQYVRDVEKAKVVEGWKGSFGANNSDLSAVKAQLDTFLSYATAMKAGEKFSIDFVEDRVEVTDRSGKKREPIQGAAFQKALLRVWLGPKPPCAGLKEGILGN